MKRRIFYVIHLDKSRILILSLFLLGIVLGSFVAGQHVGRIWEVDERQNYPSLSQNMPAIQGVTLDVEKKEGINEKEEEVLEKSKSEAKSSSDEYTLIALAPKKPRQEFKSSKRKKKVFDTSQKDGKATTLRLANNSLNKKRSSAQKKKSKPQIKQRRKQKIKIAKVTPQKIRKRPLPKKKLRLANKAPIVKKSKKSNYTLQLGAFRSVGAAQRMLDSLERNGFSARTHQERGLYLVQTGNSSSKQSIDKLSQRLRNKNFSPRIIKKN